MTTAFLSDIHLSADHPATVKMFHAFLATARGEPPAPPHPPLKTLYILGDLFDYWVGDDCAAYLHHTQTEAALRQTTDAGIKIYFLPGNRDFLVGEQFARRTGCQILPDPTLIHLPDHPHPLLLTHGDALCTDDTEHQQARALMLSPAWQQAFLQKPLPTRITEAETLRRQSEAGKRTKTQAMMDVNQTAVETLLRQHNTHTLIHGHTHQPAIHPFTLANQPATRYVLGDWPHRRRILYAQNGELNLQP